MAGHSKWANIKHKKAKQDQARGKLFTRLSKDITLAAKQGGGDPDTNFRLRLAVNAAKAANMPNDTIDKAIKRGTGALGGQNLEEVVYEGYGPGGVAILVNALTDNRNRTAGEVRFIFSKNGGNLGTDGCVAWMFDRQGVILAENPNGISEDDILMAALDAGATDVEIDEEVEVLMEPDKLEAVEKALADIGLSVTDAEVVMQPQNTVDVDGDDQEKLEKLLDALEDNDDVQSVFHNANL
ncbi:MAG: YebC/PmpR family DNA-binding transcriptional regulator [Bacillota bacterium]|jgi:YebC/PmpR family DNA-binding regulatory protein|nr:YebC/PmpR family DNA-binding transcriptional regulator [Bacillota bacterium]NLU54743.1 YebC/PmpR family DNA-binding transcriptional regulator [Bacillota bacterium]HPZ72448.1 YebC/PmpR family DNA-binding transcriptional regulator [Bacillota bacterium]HQD77380.1 YebC/PmpR family DNA-binding transcriptional regulator [Bacillota bacterium]